jgi:hypothetical protein
MKRARCRPAKNRKRADKKDEDEFLGEDDRDPRPFWRRVNPEAGLPLWEAMLFYGDPITAEVAATRKLEGFDQPPFYPFEEMTREEQREYNAGSHQLERTSRDLQYEILEKLRTGKLFPTGYATNARLDEPPARIFADLWRLLELDGWNSAAKGNGIEISGILIFKPKRRAAASLVHKRYSPADLRRWYLGWVAEREGFENGLMRALGGPVKSGTILIEMVRRSGEKDVLQALFGAAGFAHPNSPARKIGKNSGISAVLGQKCHECPDIAGGGRGTGVEPSPRSPEYSREPKRTGFSWKRGRAQRPQSATACRTPRPANR